MLELCVGKNVTALAMYIATVLVHVHGVCVPACGMQYLCSKTLHVIKGSTSLFGTKVINQILCGVHRWKL